MIRIKNKIFKEVSKIKLTKTCTTRLKCDVVITYVITKSDEIGLAKLATHMRDLLSNTHVSQSDMSLLLLQIFVLN